MPSESSKAWNVSSRREDRFIGTIQAPITAKISGRTGRILTQQALAGGHVVTALNRRPESFPLHDPRLTVCRGDAYDLASVDRVIDGQDAVLSVLGVPYGRAPITVYSERMSNILASMNRHAVRRLVCVSSTAADSRYDNGGGFFFERFLKPMIAGTIGRTTYVDQRRMESLVSASDLDWTIVRPSGLFESPEITEYELTTGYNTGKFTSRLDLAACMLRLLGDEQYIREPVAVATVSIQPRLLQMIVREAFPHRSKSLAPEW
jgi:putative NADH-flavin reductase